MKIRGWGLASPLTAASFAAVVGMLVYFLDRDPETVYFIPDWISIAGGINPVFGPIGYYLPTFIHVYVFILLTFIVLSPSNMMVYSLCFAWFVIDSVFELAQITPVAQWIAWNIPQWFSEWPFLENTAGYFLAGTFDYFDLISIALGTIAAYITIRLSNRRRIDYVQSNQQA